MTQAERHEALVERGARALCDTWGYNWEDGGPHEVTAPLDAGDDVPGRALFMEAFRAALAVIRDELATVTPEMADAATDAGYGRYGADDTGKFTAMLNASALGKPAP